MPGDIDPTHHNRRRHSRYPATLELKYRLATGASGTGHAANISSGGLYFVCTEVLPMGVLIEVDLRWPALLDERQPLQLRVYGMTVRSTRAGTAMAISKYEFLTMRRSSG
jgi:hypothetical protein